MPVITQVMTAEWFNDTTNDLDFSSNVSDKYNVFTGNVDENVKLKATVRTLTYIELRDYFIKSDGALISIYCSGAFVKDISVGDSFRLYFHGFPTLDLTGVVTSVTDNILYFTPSIIPWTLPGTTFEFDTIFITSALPDMTYKWGVFDDPANPAYISPLDGSTQNFSVKGMSTSLFNTVTANSSGKNWKNGDFKAKFKGYALSPTAYGNLFPVCQEFEIEHTFILQNYNEEQKEDILSDLKPLDYLGSLTKNYGAEISFYKDINEPSTIKKAALISNGNIGWYNEIFNGTTSDKFISNVVFKRFSNDEIIQGLCVEKTKASFTISNCTSNTKIVLRHKRLLDKEDYYLKDTLYNTLFLNENIRVINNVGVSNGIFENAKITLIGSNLNVEFDIDISNNALFGLDYLLTVSVEENKLNRANFIVNKSQYIGGFDVDGLVEDAECLIFPRGYTQGFSKVNLMLDELCQLKFNFSLVNSLGAELQDLQVWTILTNGIDYIPLDLDEIDITNITLINGVQRIDEQYTYNYAINLGSFKWISNDLTKSFYQLEMPYRVPSQQNIENLKVPSIFYDTSKPKNGLNINAFDKQMNGYSIKIGLYLLVSGTEYLFYTENIEIKDYEQNL
jgi:hypothetical protein